MAGVWPLPRFGAVGPGTAAAALPYGGENGAVGAVVQGTGLGADVAWTSGIELPGATTAGRNPQWQADAEMPTRGAWESTVDAQIAALPKLAKGVYFPPDVVREVLADELSGASDLLESSVPSRRERGARGALAVLPTLHGTAATVVAYASGRGMLDSLMLACPAVGTCTAPATTVARLGGQILEIVAGGWGDGGHGAFARGAVAVRSRYQLTVIKVSADVSHSTHTHKEFSFEVHRDIDNLPERSCGVAINHVLHMECAVILESGSLLCVGETVDTHHTPTSWLSGALGSGAAIGCEYAHHPREVCVHRSSGLGLWDLRSPPKSCWRLLWDVGSEARRGSEAIVSAATLRFSQFQFAAATSGGVYLMDSRRPGRAVCAWELGGTEPPAFLSATAGESAGPSSAGDVIHNLTTCSINLAETVGYGFTDGIELPTSARAVPSWPDLVGSSRVGPCAVGLPCVLGTAWEKRGVCPVLHQQRVRSPTVGFGVVCSQKQLSRAEGRRASFLALRSTATGDLFVRRCEVGSASRTNADVPPTADAAKAAWTLWAGDAAAQGDRLWVADDDSDGNSDSCDDDAGVGENTAIKALAKAQEASKRDGPTLAMLLSRGKSNTFGASATTPAAVNTGEVLSGVVAEGQPTESPPLISAIEATIIACGPRTMRELGEALRNKYRLQGLNELAQVIRASTKVAFQYTPPPSIRKDGDSDDDEGDALADAVVGLSATISPAVVTGVDGSSTFDIDAYWRQRSTPASSVATTSAAASNSATAARAWGGTPQPRLSRSGAGAAKRSQSMPGVKSMSSSSPGVFKSPIASSGKKPKKQKTSTPRRAGF